MMIMLYVVNRSKLENLANILRHFILIQQESSVHVKAKVLNHLLLRVFASQDN